MELVYSGERYECARAVRGDDWICLYNEAVCETAYFGGITDFGEYALDGGEWDAPPPDINAFVLGMMEGLDDA